MTESSDVWKHIRNSLIGGILLYALAVGTQLAARTVVDDSKAQPPITRILLSEMILAVVGAVGGWFVGWVTDKRDRQVFAVESTGKSIKKTLDKLSATADTVTDLVTASSRILNAYEQFRPYDKNVGVQLWALEIARPHFNEIPSRDPGRARTEFCQYLADGLDHCEIWLGVHEDGIDFFNHDCPRYLDKLNNEFNGKRFRVFVRTEKNREELLRPRIIEEYYENNKAVSTFIIDRSYFREKCNR